ncbi:hypothetical protein ACQJBY_040057 [Aegilops geniculata]
MLPEAAHPPEQGRLPDRHVVRRHSRPRVGGALSCRRYRSRWSAGVAIVLTSEESRVSGATSRSRGLWPENASACASAPYGVASWSRIRGPVEGHCAPPSPLYEKIGRGLCLTGATASSSSARCMHVKASSPLP